MHATRRSTVIAAIAAASIAVALPAAASAAQNPPGDIPDNQAFVTYRAPAFSLQVPEGWQRTVTGAAVRFSDKYNSIEASVAPAAVAPTTVSTARNVIARLKSTVKGFAQPKVTTVRRRSGSAVLVTYRATSEPNAVTGKSVTNDVGRYEFWHAGKAAVITLQAPAGSDNVDPWKVVTDSFRWSR